MAWEGAVHGGPLVAGAVPSPATGGEIALPHHPITDGHAHVLELGLGVHAGTDTDAAGGYRFHRGLFDVDRQDHVAAVSAEHLLHVVGRCAVGPGRVEADEVRVPALLVDIGKQRGIGGEFDDVAIAFQAGHEGRFAQGRLEIALAALETAVVDADGVFAEEDGAVVALLTVVTSRVLHEVFRLPVAMRVDDLHGTAANLTIGHHMDVGILGLDGVVEEAVVVLVDRAVVLITDFDILQAEGGGMAGLGPQAPTCSPQGRWHTR